MAWPQQLKWQCTKTQYLSQSPSTGLPHPSSTTAVFSYATGSRKLSANEQFLEEGAGKQCSECVSE